MSKDTQLCWECKRATGGCRWSADLKPVKGWDAEKVIIKDFEGDIESYKVKACPLFIPESKIGRRINIRQLAELINAPYEEIRRKKDDFLIMLAKNSGYLILIESGKRRGIFLKGRV